MHDPDGFACRLDLALRARRIGKMYALAVALGVDGSALSRWRRGKPISIDSLIRLAHHLGVSIDWLLTGAGAMDSPGAAAVATWQSEVVADLAALDPAIRERLADLIRRLAAARRVGCFEEAAWMLEPGAEAAHESDRRGAAG